MKKIKNVRTPQWGIFLTHTVTLYISESCLLNWPNYYYWICSLYRVAEIKRHHFYIFACNKWINLQNVM